MRFSRHFGTTHREEPHEAEIPSHKLMLRAGMIHQTASGVYAYYPLAWRSLRKIEQIIREEMDAEGGQELRPVRSPANRIVGQIGTQRAVWAGPVPSA